MSERSSNIVPAEPLFQQATTEPSNLERDSMRSGSGLVDEVADWLMSQALGEYGVEDIVVGCSRRLLAAGIPISRSFVFFRTLHPQFAAINLVWRRDDESVGKLEALPAEAFTSRQWRQSPFQHMLDTGVPYVRRRLVGDGALFDFPVLSEFKDRGVTDYLAYNVSFEAGAGEELPVPGLLGSWTTDRPSGFTEQDIKALLRIERRLAVACKMTIKGQISKNILSAYLGESAGRQVLQGKIKRGDAERIHAVIWFSDLRGSTALAEKLPMDEYFATLNEFLEAMAGAIIDNGGEVLRFIGDAVSAIFPIDTHDADCQADCPAHIAACCTAFEATRDAMGRMDSLNEARASRGQSPLNFGIGLHVGDVMFGNIGAPGRVEFSVTGHAANKAARIESLSKRLGHRLIVSSAFAAILREPWQSLGTQALDGVEDSEEVFTLSSAPAA